MEKPIRVDIRYLKKWLQAKMDEHGIGLKVKSGYKTRFASKEYDNGAARWILKVGEDGSEYDATVYCLIDRPELEWALNSGRKLIWRLKDHKYIEESEITYV